MPSQPPPPDSLPNYLAEGLPKQDRETLLDARDYIDDLLALLEAPVEPAVLPDEATVVDESPGNGGTIVEERVKCGSECTCNDRNGHGPYRYRYLWDGEKLRSEYLGKA